MNTKKSKSQKVVSKRSFVGYPVGDFLIRIKNAARSGKPEVIQPKTKLIEAVAKVLKEEGFLSEVTSREGELCVSIAREAKEPVILGLSILSRPGLRRYLSSRELAKMRGPEIYILSTPAGVMSSKNALKKNVGGEVIAKIW